MRRIFAAWALGVSLASATASATTVSNYTAMLLGGSEFTAPLDINDSDQIVGRHYQNRHYGAYLYTPGHGMTDVVTGGVAYAGGVNETGQVAGFGPASINAASSAFLYTPGVGTTFFAPLSSGHNAGYEYDSSAAFDVNNFGVIAGDTTLNQTFTVNGQTYLIDRPAIHDATGWHTLGSIGGNQASSYGINDSGQVVGWATTANEATQHAFLYTPGIGIQDLGANGGFDSFANSISNDGTVVGYYTSAQGFTRAFRYDSRGFSDIGSGVATDINNSDLIVGTNGSYAFLYANSRSYDLNSLVTAPHNDYVYAYAINDIGRIVVRDSVNNYFLLSPVRGIPEPSLWGMMILGFFTVSWAMRRAAEAAVQHQL